MFKIKLLDLFCGAGGCAVGYHRAGIDEIVGIDIEEQHNYPYEFIRGDAIAYLNNLIESGEINKFDMIHASPPCQGYSRTKSLTKDNEYPKLIKIIRGLILKTGLPYVIENVEQAKKDMINPIRLCGEMFKLKVVRHRLFESNIPIKEPEHKKHIGKVYNTRNDVGKESYCYWGVYGHYVGTLEEWSNAMGIDWMGKSELAQAIPPAYTEYISKQIINK